MATQINVIKKSAEEFEVRFNYDAYLVRRIKLLSGASFNQETQSWQVPVYAGKVLVKGEWKPVNQLSLVRRGHLNPNFEVIINYQDLTQL